MIHLWPISAGHCLEIPSLPLASALGAPRVQSHLHLAENISPTIQGMAFKMKAGVMQVGHEEELIVGRRPGAGVVSLYVVKLEAPL